MTVVPWDTILRAAEAAARFLPPPANAVMGIAASIARGVVADGCSIDGCPAEIDLSSHVIPPEGERMLRLRDEARRRIAWADADELSRRSGR